MAEQNKILTVSYGTFSCTLEGFEDSFGTMKAIAEYFRDLAADDRYFGAEPPTPDAEMLTRIAEREIDRRVEARSNEDGIVLRATEALAAPGVADVDEAGVGQVEEATAADTVEIAEDAATNEAVIAAEPPVAEEDVAGQPVAEETVETSDASMEPAAMEGDSDPVEAAALDDDSADDDTAEEYAAQDDSIAEDSNTDAAQDEQIETLIDAAAGDDAPEIAETAPVYEDEDGEDLSQPPAAGVVAANPAPIADPDSVAAKLQRIRAVVGHGVTAASVAKPDTAVVEDSDADVEDTAVGSETIAAILGEDSLDDEADAPSLEVAVEADIAADEAEDDPEPVRPRIVRADRDFVGAAEVTPAVEAERDLPDEADEQTSDDGYSGIAALDGADELDIDPDFEDVSDLDADLLEELQQAAAEADEAQDAPAIDDDAVAIDGEIEDDLEETFETAEVDLEAVADDSDVADIEVADSDVVDSAEPVDVSSADDVSGTVGSDEPEAEVRRGARLSAPAEADEEVALSRLISQVDAKLNDPESKGRRSAISHLKAAVAAKEASRQLGEEEEVPQSAETAFRDDLNEVVRPRSAATPAAATPQEPAKEASAAEPEPAAAPRRPARPTVTRARSERPRPAPLKLVAEQRVDTPAEGNSEAASAPAAPVRPRRVGRDASATAPVDGAAFRSWAEERGAFSLADLVEAAAAHTATVEGSDEFARPYIMRKVRAAVPEQCNREDELRAFGTLLRQGLIEKVRAGRFRISPDSRFFDQPRAARG